MYLLLLIQERPYVRYRWIESVATHVVFTLDGYDKKDSEFELRNR